MIAYGLRRHNLEKSNGKSGMPKCKSPLSFGGLFDIQTGTLDAFQTVQF